jgi:hypothetical protein
MPKTTIDYSKTVIYKIVCKDLSVEETYIGNTTDFRRRKSEHKNRCQNSNGKDYHENKYEFIRNNGGWDNWEMIEVEKYPCNDGNEARQRERFWFEFYHLTLNKLYPARTKQEYDLARYKHKKNEIIANLNIKIRCVCGATVRKGGMLRHLKTSKHLNKNKIDNNFINEDIQE